jgi:hypothetical protein
MFSPTVRKMISIHIRNVIFLGFGKHQDTWCPTLKCAGHWVAAPYNPLNSGQMGSLYTGNTFLFQLLSSLPNFQSQACIPISLVFMSTEHTHIYDHQCINLLSFTSMSYDIFDQNHTFFIILLSL